MHPLLSIIIPAHNEEVRLPESMDRILSFLAKQPYTSEVLVVENGSLDRTFEIAAQYAREHEQVAVLQEEQAGKGRAVRRGMLEAKGQYRFICDADLSMPISEVNRFLPPERQDYDIAIASREAPGAVRFGEPAYRHWVGRVFNFLVRAIAVRGFQDTQCGFKCFRGPIADRLFPLQQLNGWTFDVEVLFLAQRFGFRIIEVPIPWYYHPGSRVRLFQDSLAMLADLFRIRINWMRGVYISETQDGGRA